MIRTLRAVHRRAVLQTVRYNSTLPPGSSRDPSHKNLFYHLSPPPPSAPSKVLISFLPSAPAEKSRTYLGSLPATGNAGLADFEENPGFRELLHKSVKEAIESGVAETVEYEAMTRPGDGYLSITDERNIPAPGRVGDPDDLIASIFVKDGKLVPSTYEPLHTYRLVTGEGVCTLPRGIDSYVVNALEKVDQEEK